MGRAHRYTESEVRGMLRLARELAEMPSDRDVRTMHMLKGICGLVGANGSSSFLARHDFPDHKRKITVLSGQTVGMDDRSAQAAISRYLSTMVPADPLADPLYNSPGRQVTMAREQIMDRHNWHYSEHFNEVRCAIGIDDCIATKIQLGSGNHVLTVCVHRAPGERPFTRRQWEVLDLFHSEMHRLLDVRSPEPLRRLSPRQRQVLECMCAGDGAKQIARRLTLSPHTVRDHIKEIYERFGVSGRGELMACFTHGATQVQ